MTIILFNKSNKRGQVFLYVVWFFTAIIVLIVAAVAAPMGVQFNSALYAAGEQILLDANNSIQSINDTAVRTRVNAMLTDALAAQENNIEVNAGIFQYSWIFVLILTMVVVFLFTRQTVEFGQGGGFIG